MEAFVRVLELIGTVAFSASGALIAMKKRMDLLGVIVLGVITAVGGGILRDLILGITPPLAFRDPLCVIVATATSVLLFIPWLRHHLMHNQQLFDTVLLVMDSIGLGVFTVMGIWNALAFDPERSTFLLVFVGVLTGVGGGVIRDVLAGNLPFILVKYVYACASLIGALTCALLWRVLPSYAAMLIGMLLVLVIRLLAAHYHWNLPHVDDVE
ncbi:MAG: trimeric intracellular cation channel family protein [Oscillospiraceae bacterium]|nr:trimeric intracellular cation channel family protein [Oscillospiraceae bacterium]